MTSVPVWELPARFNGNVCSPRCRGNAQVKGIHWQRLTAWAFVLTIGYLSRDFVGVRNPLFPGATMPRKLSRLTIECHLLDAKFLAYARYAGGSWNGMCRKRSAVENNSDAASFPRTLHALTTVAHCRMGYPPPRARTRQRADWDCPCLFIARSQMGAVTFMLAYLGNSVINFLSQYWCVSPASPHACWPGRSASACTLDANPDAQPTLPLPTLLPLSRRVRCSFTENPWLPQAS